MSLPGGARLGPYEILSPLGAGGMGEVYKARDTKLDRDVAVKVLPEEFAKDPERLARFEREAKAVAALSHPNILAIFDFGQHEGKAYAVTELLEGETLRERLSAGALPVRKAVEAAVQIAHGLGAAHDKGIVHRDLKPENLFLTKDGRVKILDFGLAKMGGPIASDSGRTMTTPPEGATGPGVVLGTVGYMSPEQVRGRPADHRSDIFSLGTVLYEMVLGVRAFQRDTAAETMTAILKEDPPELEQSGKAVPPGLQRVIHHCLEKDPAHRFHDAHDLAFALENLGGSGASGTAIPASSSSVARSRKEMLAWAVAGTAIAVAAIAAYLAGTHGQRGVYPTFRPLTRERGTVTAARFVPGTSDVAYSARWGGGSSRLYVTRADQAAPRQFPDFEGILQSVSASGDLLGLSETYLSRGAQHGRLVSVPLAGGGARAVAVEVLSADQGGSGETALAIYDDGVSRLEWPLGREIVRTYDNVRSVKVRGQRLAFFRDKDNTVEDGEVLLAERGTAPKAIAAVDGFTGMAWGPGGRALWVSTFNDGESRILSLDPRGGTRTLLTHAGRLELQDVDEQGRALALVNSYQRQVFGRARGGDRDEDMSWRDAQSALSISGDGSLLLLGHRTGWVGLGGHLYLRPMAGGPAQDLGEGSGQSILSADGRWVCTSTDTPVFGLKLLPTGPGAPRTVPLQDFAGAGLAVTLLPDGRHGLSEGTLKNRPNTFYQIDLETGSYRQVAPDNVSGFNCQTITSPDGGWFACGMDKAPNDIAPKDGELLIAVYRIDGTAPRMVRGMKVSEAISGWYRDASALVIFDRNVLPAPVTVLDVATGGRTPLPPLMPPDPVGISGIEGLCMAPDGGAYAYNVVRQLSELYLIEGLK